MANFQKNGAGARYIDVRMAFMNQFTGPNGQSQWQNTDPKKAGYVLPDEAIYEVDGNLVNVAPQDKQKVISDMQKSGMMIDDGGKGAYNKWADGISAGNGLFWAAGAAVAVVAFSLFG